MERKTENLRIVIYGAGAVGGVVGGLLALSQTSVVLIGRSHNMNVINKLGLQVVTPNAIRVVRLPVVTTPDQIVFGSNDVVFLCVKSQNTERAMIELNYIVKDIPIFCFQNGVANEEIVSKYYPRVYGVMVSAGSVFLEDGRVESRSEPPGRFVIGRYPQGVDALVESVAPKLRNAGYEVLVTPDVMSYKWGKLLLNLNNVVEAITNASGKQVSRITIAVQNEGREILTHAGVHWIPIGESPPRQPKVSERPNSELKRATLGSTWQSLARRQGTVETQFLNGEIIRVANLMGKQAPINETLLRIAQEMASNKEQPGKYTPEQLVEILRLQ
jgi:2-dehydropantoate 2-reductase